MINSEVVSYGVGLCGKYPQVKRWSKSDTFALFSSVDLAILISVDKEHSNDWVGMKIENPHDNRWVQVENFEIAIRG